MPLSPTPYSMRDWRAVALQYDSFVYDVAKTGQYLPLCFLMPSGVNYPQSKSYRLHTYVGTNSPNGNEAINVMPSVIGATLAGIDKSDQFGQDWVRMCQDYFNKANGEGIYLNAPATSSGNDWWYDMMPNIYFYQLYDLYPEMGGEAELQFISVADRMLEAVKAMGGSATPWQPAYMNYRAWKFKTMEPHPGGVKEPEAAGAFAWLLHHAWLRTGRAEYLQGAEWAMDFLANWGSNPSYELQLPYGTYIAARMNAELGTEYDVARMVNWSFDRGPLRGWGTIVGKWGGFDVSGLVGEANDAGNDYAFQLNGVQQAAALVPMVRYDKRFARAIGKWMLNLANATRLFYPGYLPANQQDASAWSAVNDPGQVVGYEALRQKWQNLSPFSTGDAVVGGWAATNLALYGTSSIGYLGGMIEKTNIDRILRIDLRRTDFFAPPSYPTYLFFNPYSLPQAVQFDAGSALSDIYGPLGETFLHQGVSGQVSLTIPPGQALIAVVTPANGVVTYDRNRMMVDGVVVDYGQTSQPWSRAPRIRAFAAVDTLLAKGQQTVIHATVAPGTGPLTYHWQVTKGQLNGNGSQAAFTAPPDTGMTTVRFVATDSLGAADTAWLDIPIVAKINLAPQVAALWKSAPYTVTGGLVQVQCTASDPNGDALTFAWSVSGGTLSGSGADVTWTAPSAKGILTASVTVTDTDGASATASTSLLVEDFQPFGKGAVARYPFSGDAQDVSGNGLHGAVNGAILVPDRNGLPKEAYYLAGGAQHIQVANSPLLNFQDGISVGCWFKASDLPDKETFLLSHGSWQNRWKLSITPERRLRWTINTLSTITDLDLDINLEVDSQYHAMACYDGQLMTLYLNGVLRSYKPSAGKIRTTTTPFLMAQMLPGQSAYNFKGVLDEVQIYGGALSPDEVQSIYSQELVALEYPEFHSLVLHVEPNPASGMVRVSLPQGFRRPLRICLWDPLGRMVLERAVRDEEDPWVDLTGMPGGLYILRVQGGNFHGHAHLLKS